MRYRASITGADWYRVSWDVDREEAPREWSTLLEIPGVKYYPLALEIPRTAWMLPEVVDVLSALDVTPPRHHEKYSSLGHWQPTREAFEHQHAVVAMLLKQSRVLLADCMGLAKTSSAIIAGETVRRNIYHGERPLLIVGPLRTRRTWLRELLATGAISKPEELCVLVSRDLSDACWRDNATHYFIHYDVVDAWWSRFTSIRPCVTILDEAQYLKNGRSRRTRNAAMVTHTAPFRMLLTGTPIANKPKDLYALVDLLNGPHTWGSPTTFRQRYCGAYRGNYGFVDTEPTNTEELQTRMASFYLRRELADTNVNLPTFTRELVEAEVNPKKVSAFAEQTSHLSARQIQDLVRVMVEGSLGTDALRTIAQLRKATSDAKRETTLELASDILEADGAVVVFTWQRSTAVALQRALDPSREAITGAVDIQARFASVDHFQEHGGGLVATYGALADSVTLHRSRVVIQHDLDYLPSTMLQSEKRIHRIGQTRSCKSYWIIAPAFLDRVLMVALRKKCADQEKILELDEMLPELAVPTQADDFTLRMEQAMQEWKSW